jgi:hypothetical protein
MDAIPPVVEIAAPDRETLRDRRGVIIGTIEGQRFNGKLIGRDARGVVVGSFDAKSNETRDARGLLVGRGNLPPALLLMGR